VTVKCEMVKCKNKYYQSGIRLTVKKTRDICSLGNPKKSPFLGVRDRRRHFHEVSFLSYNHISKWW